MYQTCLHSRGGDAHISCASVHEPAHSLDRLLHELFGDITYPLKNCIGRLRSRSLLYVTFQSMNLNLPCISTRPACTGLAWDASLLRLPAGHCSSPVLPASLLACSGSQTFPALRHTEGRNSRGTHGHSILANLQKVLLDFFFKSGPLKQREIRFSDTFLLQL